MDTKIIRSEIEDFKPYTPGLTIEEIKDKYGLQNVIKLASNENPLGTSAVAQKAVAKVAAAGFRYPQNGNPDLVTAISKKIGMPEEQILVGNGSDELIDMIVRVRCRPGVDHVLTYEGSFSMYRMVAKLCGVEYKEVPRDTNFTHPLHGLLQAANENTGVIFITSPDNPTGLAVPAEELMILRASLPKETILVIDEAYIDYTSPREKYDLLPFVKERDDIVLYRTFSKAYGLAGFRAGYGVVPLWLGEYMRRSRIPFTVNIAAEAAAKAVLEDDIYYNETLRITAEAKVYMTRELMGMGCEVLDSQSNFLMIRTVGMDGTDCFQALLERGIIVRPLAGFGMPEYIRVNVGMPEENEAFIAAIKEVLGK
ncbi:MAG: histidinol-phosphate transaminase [Desulfovibrio sp.]